MSWLVVQSFEVSICLTNGVVMRPVVKSFRMVLDSTDNFVLWFVVELWTVRWQLISEWITRHVMEQMIPFGDSLLRLLMKPVVLNRVDGFVVQTWTVMIGLFQHNVLR